MSWLKLISRYEQIINQLLNPKKNWDSETNIDDFKILQPFVESWIYTWRKWFIHLAYHPRLRQPHLIPSSAGGVPTRTGPAGRKSEWLNNRKLGDTVDGRNPAPVEVGSLSHYLQGFIIIHPRWCRISSINSMESLKMKKSWWWVLLERGTTEVYKPFKEGIYWQLVSNIFCNFTRNLGRNFAPIWLAHIFSDWESTTN